MLYVKACVFTFTIICRRILLRMRSIADRICREYKNTGFTFSNVFQKILPFMG